MDGQIEAKALRGSGGSSTLDLPESVIEAIASSLFGTQLLRARLVDRRWHAIISQLVRTVIISTRQTWAESPRARSEALAKTFKGLQNVLVIMDANRNPRNFEPSIVSEALSPLVHCKSLTSLQVIWRTWIVPNEGYSEEHFDAFVERWTSLAALLSQGFKHVLPQLAPKLTAIDLNTQGNMLKMLQPVLSGLTQLTSLRYTLSDHYTVCTDDACVLYSLSSLKTLYIRCWLTPNFSETLLVALSRLTNLSSLEIDAISIPPEDNLVASLSHLTALQGLSSLCTKGMGIGSVSGLSKLSNLQDLTLTMSESLGMPGWHEIAALSSLTALNVNAWNDVAPVETASALQHVQPCDHISALCQLPLKSLGIKIPSLRDLRYLSALTSLTELIVALQPPPPAAHAAAAAAAAGAGAGAGPGAGAGAAAVLLRGSAAGSSGLQGSLSCVSALSRLQQLRSLDLYDAGGHIRLTQSLLQDACSWWPHLTNLYFEGVITVQNLGKALMPNLDHLALINTNALPFLVDLNQLPAHLTFLELQNAVVVFQGKTASRLEHKLCSVSMMKGITWMDLSTPGNAQVSCMTLWLAGCSLLTSLRLDLTMAWWAEQLLQGATSTPLAALAAAPSLMFLDLMLVDSSEASEGLIDNRLVDDLAALAKLEELQVWTRVAADWHEDIGFLPLARGGASNLRLLELEVLPYSKALVCRDVLSAAMPNCRFRLVADRIGELIS